MDPDIAAAIREHVRHTNNRSRAARTRTSRCPDHGRHCVPVREVDARATMDAFERFYEDHVATCTTATTVPVQDVLEHAGASTVFKPWHMKRLLTEYLRRRACKDPVLKGRGLRGAHINADEDDIVLVLDMCPGPHQHPAIDYPTHTERRLLALHAHDTAYFVHGDELAAVVQHLDRLCAACGRQMRLVSCHTYMHYLVWDAPLGDLPALADPMWSAEENTGCAMSDEEDD